MKEILSMSFFFLFDYLERFNLVIKISLKKNKSI